MNTIRYYKKRGLKFVEGDKRTSYSKSQYDVLIDNSLVDGHNMPERDLKNVLLDQEMLEFAWRINEDGENPSFNGEIEVGYASSDYHRCKCSDVSFNLGYSPEHRINRWRPVIVTPPVNKQLDPRKHIDDKLVIVANGDAYDSSLVFTILVAGNREVCVEDCNGYLRVLVVDEHEFYNTPEAKQLIEVAEFIESKDFAPTEDLYALARELQKAGFLKEI